MNSNAEVGNHIVSAVYASVNRTSMNDFLDYDDHVLPVPLADAQSTECFDNLLPPYTVNYQDSLLVSRIVEPSIKHSNDLPSQNSMGNQDSSLECSLNEFNINNLPFILRNMSGHDLLPASQTDTPSTEHSNDLPSQNSMDNQDSSLECSLSEFNIDNLPFILRNMSGYDLLPASQTVTAPAPASATQILNTLSVPITESTNEDVAVPLIKASETAVQEETIPTLEFCIQWRKDKRFYSCATCGNKFTHRAFLVNHMITHAKEKPYVCDGCNKCFTQLNILREHQSYVGSSCLLLELRTVTTINPQPQVLDTLSVSITESADRDEAVPLIKTLKTNVWKKITPTKNSHVEYRDELLYVCDMMNTHGEPCRRHYKFRMSLKTHQRNHTGESLYACDICVQRFTLKNNLRRHVMLHTDQKSFVCATCNRKFAAKTTLINHEKSHSKKKPYDCNICGKCYTRKSILKIHQENKHSKKFQKPSRN